MGRPAYANVNSTERREQIYRFMVAYQRANNGVPPTVREIKEAVGLSSINTVNYHLRVLGSIGYIVRAEGRHCWTVPGTWIPDDVLS